MITITKRQAWKSARLHEARNDKRRRENERRAGKRDAARVPRWGESKYNYTKVSRNTETESRGNRRVSLKLESCFETARLPCRLQPRHRRALPFPNSVRPFVPSRVLSYTSVPRWSRERFQTKRNFSAPLADDLLRENYATRRATTFSDFYDRARC